MTFSSPLGWRGGVPDSLLAFKSSRGKWEIGNADHVMGVGTVSSGSADGFVHVNERVCLRSSSGLCLQLAVRCIPPLVSPSLFASRPILCCALVPCVCDLCDCVCAQNTSHGTTRVCLGRSSGAYGVSQLGSLDWYFVKAHAPFEPVRSPLAAAAALRPHSSFCFLFSAAFVV